MSKMGSRRPYFRPNRTAWAAVGAGVGFGDIVDASVGGEEVVGAGVGGGEVVGAGVGFQIHEQE